MLDVEQSRLRVLEPAFFANGAEVGGARKRALGPPTRPLVHRGAWRRRAGGGGGLCTALKSKAVARIEVACTFFLRPWPPIGEPGGPGPGGGRARAHRAPRYYQLLRRAASSQAILRNPRQALGDGSPFPVFESAWLPAAIARSSPA
jgi:hypothetical protein